MLRAMWKPGQEGNNRSRGKQEVKRGTIGQEGNSTNINDLAADCSCDVLTKNVTVFCLFP